MPAPRRRASGGTAATEVGSTLLEAYRSTLGAADLRATTSALGVDLSRLGVSIAGASRDPAKILAWAERLRGNALRAPAASPSTDRRLRREQDELRTLDRALQRAEKNAKAARALGSRREDVEATVRTHARLLPGRVDARKMQLDVAAATRALRDRALVEYVEPWTADSTRSCSPGRRSRCTTSERSTSRPTSSGFGSHSGGWREAASTAPAAPPRWRMPRPPPRRSTKSSPCRFATRSAARRS